MAEIKQELILVDQFSKVFDRFIEMLEDSAHKQDDLGKKLIDNNKHLDDMRDNLNKFGDTAFKAAESGVTKLMNRVIGLGAAYLGFNKIRQTVTEAMDNEKLSYHLAEEFGHPGQQRQYYDASMAFGNKYGEKTGDIAGSLEMMSRITQSASRVEQLMDMAARLTVKNSGTTVAGNAQMLSNMLLSRNVSGLSSMGIDQADINKKRLNFNLEMGNLDYVVNALDELMNKAGMTEEAFNRISDSPAMKLKMMGNTWSNYLNRAMLSFLDGIKPAIDYLQKFTHSEQFMNVMAAMSKFFRLAGEAAGALLQRLLPLLPVISEGLVRGFQILINIGSFIVQNWEILVDVAKKLFIAFVAVKGAVILLNIAMTVFKGIQIISAAAATAHATVMGIYATATGIASAAQWGFNAAIAACPISWIVVAVIALILALGVLVTALNKMTTGMSWVGAAMTTVVQGGIYLFNILANTINSVINTLNTLWKALGAIGNLLYGVFTNPIGAIANALIDLYIIVSDWFINMIKPVDMFSDAIGNVVVRIGEMINALGPVAKGLGIDGNVLINAGNGIKEKGVTGSIEEARNEGVQKLRNLNKRMTGYEPKYDITEDKFKTIDMIDVSKAQQIVEEWGKKFEEFKNAVAGIGDVEGVNFAAELDKLKPQLDKILGEIMTGNDTLSNINYSLDPDAWLDGFKEFAVDEQEYKHVTRLNNTVQSPVVNLGIKGTGDVTKINFKEVMREIEKSLQQYYDIGGADVVEAR